MRVCLSAATAAALLLITGCRSAYVETTVINNTSAPIPLLEVDYPSASFGTQNLDPGASFHYRFKILGNGTTRLLYTDATHHDHSFPGPDLQEGYEGQLTIEIASPTPVWHLAATKKP